MLIKNKFCYPVMLNVAEKQCVIIGGGIVAARKLKTLAAAGAEITLVAPFFCIQVKETAKQYNCKLIHDKYRAEYLRNAFLVIAATDNKDINRKISETAVCLVNNVTEPELSNFSVPSSFSEGDITVTMATGGMPAFTKLLKTEINQLITPEIAEFNDFLLEQRDLIKSTVSTPQQRTLFWRSVINQNLLNLIRAGKIAQAKEKVLDAVNSFRTES